MVSRWRRGAWEATGEWGELDELRPWASVTKLVTAMAAAVEVEQGRASLDEPLGPPGSTLAHLLAHASGLGLEEGDPVSAAGTRRVYSNLGIDLAAARLAGNEVWPWLRTRVAAPLGLDSLELRGRASEGLGGELPGFGRFDPCPWGLGVQLRGDNHHWMGDWPSASFGHFGRSGSLVLVNLEEGLVLSATSTVEFGPWAKELWPGWTSRVREEALAS